MKNYLSGAAAVIQPRKFAGILAIWAVTLLYVLFQGGKTSFMLFIMVSVLILYLVIGALGGVRGPKGHAVCTRSRRSPSCSTQAAICV